MECGDYISLPFCGCATLQSSMEWERDFPEGQELQASGISCELDPDFRKDTKDKLNPKANRSVKRAEALYSHVTSFSHTKFKH